MVDDSLLFFQAECERFVFRGVVIRIDIETNFFYELLIQILMMIFNLMLINPSHLIDICEREIHGDFHGYVPSQAQVLAESLDILVRSLRKYDLAVFQNFP